MVDFKQLSIDQRAADNACKEWEEEQVCAVIDEERRIFKKAFRLGMLHERKKNQGKIR